MMTVYGVNAIRGAIAQGLEPGAVLYVSKENTRIRALIEEASAAGAILRRTSPEKLDAKSSEGRHQGVLLEYNPDRESADWEEQLRTELESGKRPRVVLLDRIQDPGNLGAIVRSAALFGFSHLFIPEKKAAPFTAVARKAASGGDAFCRVVTVNNLVQVLEKLQEMGFWAAALEATASRSLWDEAFPDATALVIGSEESGIRRLLREKCDYLLRIPAALPREEAAGLDSLNVSVASALAFAEVFRRHSQL